MAEAQIVVDLETSLQRQLNTLWGNPHEEEKFPIFRTPHSISQNNKNLFEPSVISIGPFHRGQKHLRALEEQKRRFLRDFLSRGDEINLDLCLSAMKSLETRTRRCYSESFDDLDSDTFVEMMLLDGCFVLEYFLKSSEGSFSSISEVGWNSHFINRDLVLQENQIPFFIVDKLCDLIDFNQEFKMIFVKYIACCFLQNYPIFRDHPAETANTIDSIIADPPAEIPNPPAEIPDLLAEILDDLAEIPEHLVEIPDPPADIYHLVHLCYHYLVPNPGIPVVLRSKPFDLTRIFSANSIIKGLLHRFRSRPMRRGRSSHSTSRSLSMALPNSTRNISSVVIPSATELKQSGLKFTPKSNPKHMLDISFEHGVLKIPRLNFSDSTKSIFANLIEFEHSKYSKQNLPFTSFVAFLDKLVNTPNDVTILQECGIIQNLLDSEEDLAHFINQITEGAIMKRDHYLAELNRELNRYIEINRNKSRWNRQREKLIRDYFNSPWSTISVIAAFILLVLTFVQSFYTVYAYKYPPSS